jgi:beta-glucanase (GH16 family)
MDQSRAAAPTALNPLIYVLTAVAAIAVILTHTLAASARGGPPKPPGPPGPKQTPPSCGSTAIYKADGTAWTCTFGDDFDTSSVDTKKWTVTRTSDNGFPPSHDLCFVDTPNNVSVADGLLSLTVRQEPAPFTCKTPWGSYQTQTTGGMVTTAGKFSQTYGRFAVRASFPAATIAGLQASLWLWPQNVTTTGLSGEIDIAEEYSKNADRVIPYLHYNFDPATIDTTTNTNIYTNNYCKITDVNALHEYAVEWTPTTFTILYDGQTCLVDNLAVLGTSPFDQPYYLLLTQALGVGGNAFDPATTPLPATTRIDWVRAWK